MLLLKKLVMFLTGGSFEMNDLKIYGCNKTEHKKVEVTKLFHWCFTEIKSHDAEMET